MLTTSYLAQLCPGPGAGADCLTWVPGRSGASGLCSRVSVLLGTGGALPWVQPRSSVMCWGQFWCDMFHSAAAGSIPFHRLGFSALTVTAPVLGVSLEDEGGGVILSGSWRKQGRVIPL